MDWDCLIPKIWWHVSSISCTFQIFSCTINFIMHTKILLFFFFNKNLENAAWGESGFYLSNFLVVVLIKHWWRYSWSKTEVKRELREQGRQKKPVLHSQLVLSVLPASNQICGCLLGWQFLRMAFWILSACRDFGMQ